MKVRCGGRRGSCLSQPTKELGDVLRISLALSHQFGSEFSRVGYCSIGITIALQDKSSITADLFEGVSVIEGLEPFRVFLRIRTRRRTHPQHELTPTPIPPIEIGTPGGRVVREIVSVKGPRPPRLLGRIFGPHLRSATALALGRGHCLITY
jgi:hypothetical protein